MRIQLADDDLLMRELIATVLGAYGHEVETHGNGADVWDAFQRAPAPLVVLDWDMPVLDGLEVCRRIRGHPGGDEVYLLIVTARAKAADLEDVLNAGADDYLSKPVTPSDIAARLRIAERRMETARARRSAEEELRKARYLAGVGEVSLALQHEINNPLAALLTHSALLAGGILPPEESKATLKVIDDQARRIADVVRRLNALSDPKSVEYARGQKMVDLGAPPGARATPTKGTPKGGA